MRRSGSELASVWWPVLFSSARHKRYIYADNVFLRGVDVRGKQYKSHAVRYIT